MAAFTDRRPWSGRVGARGVAAALCVVVLAVPAWAQSVITGTASYRERIALPPDAVLEITLEDVSRPDALAEVLGTARVEPAGQVPIPFEIAYDAAKIDPSHAYSVRGRITAGGGLLFATDRTNPVLTRGRSTRVNLMLRKASHGASEPAPATDLPLVNTYWKLVELRGQAVEAVEGQREPHILLRPDEPRRVGGSGGCNRLQGGYRVEGAAIGFQGLATTRMACPRGMETEQEFLKALAEVKAWRIAGQGLEFRDGAGAVIARFEARHMK